jgi:hypothetical protein
VADWLAYQVTGLLARNPANLAVIDGGGDLVPRLKRKAAVTRLLGERLTYVDVDGAALIEGINPLAPAPGETAAATARRWRQWGSGMGLHPQGVALLGQAHGAGVEDLAGLGAWLKQQEREGGGPAVSGLKATLGRLTRDRRLRQWLAWPTNRFDALPENALFFACKDTGWDRRQLLRAVLLAVGAVPGVRLILHRFPWEEMGEEDLITPPDLVVSNGPLAPESTVVLTASHPGGVATLTERFLGNDARLAEKLSLLGRGEGMVVGGGSVSYAAWRASAQ